MANRFDFRAPGSGMGDAFVRALMEREAMRRQAALDELNRRESEAKMQLERDREARAAEQLATETANADRAFNYGLAKDQVTMAGADTRLPDGPVGDTIRKFFPTRVEERDDTLTSGSLALPISPFSPNSAFTKAEMREGKEGGTFLRPGFQYEQMREAAEERAALRAQQDVAAAEREKAAAAAKGEQAAERTRAEAQWRAAHDQNLLLIAAMNAAQKGAAANEKKAEKDAAAAKATEAGIQMRDDVIYRIDQLITVDPQSKKAVLRPGVGSLFGSTEGVLPGGTNTNAFLAGIMPGGASGEDVGSAASALQGLKSLLDVNTIRELKEQSRTGATGFGALSEKELAVLENAATTLATRTMDEAEALRELIKIRNEMVTARAEYQRELAKQRGTTGTPGAPAPAPGATTGGPRILSRRPAGGQ